MIRRLAVLVLALLTLLAPVAAGAERKVIKDGHIDMGPRFVDGRWTVQIRDDTVKPTVWRELSDVVVQVPDAARTQIPADPVYGFLGQAGNPVWLLPQVQRPDVVWPGWNTQDPEVVANVGREVTWRLGGVRGPGTFVLFLSGNFGAPQVIFDSAKPYPQETGIEINIVAVEPSPALRAVLLAKLIADPGLAERVTVVDSDVQHARLPPRFGTVIAMNMIGHLNHDDRHAFWTLCTQRLTPGGQILLNLQPPDRAESVPDNTFCTVLIGRRTYEGSGWAEPSGTDALTWHMRYRVLEDDAVVTDRAVDYHWWVVSEQPLADELRDHGLTLRQEGPAEMGMYAITRHG